MLKSTKNYEYLELECFVYTAKNKNAFLEANGHPLIAQDLLNYGSFTFYDSQTEREDWGFDGIAEAFAEFAKKEKLSFF